MRTSNSANKYIPRDFIETPENLVFAVVASGLEEERVLVFLRYELRAGRYIKLATDEANRLLKSKYPDYLYYSKLRDAKLHGVPLEKIRGHHRPRLRVRNLLKADHHDIIETKAKRLIELFIKSGVDTAKLGLTGSILIGAQNKNSDIDLVVYGRKAFVKARAATERSIDEGLLEQLDETQWRDAYARRGCALDFDDFLWHEQRKFNKGCIGGTKFDIGLVNLESTTAIEESQKLGRLKLRAEVMDDAAAFDYPARYRVDHPQCKEVVCFTPTYAGQARRGELVEVSGLLEQSERERIIVVGSSREAPGEYIKVVSA